MNISYVIGAAMIAFVVWRLVRNFMVKSKIPELVKNGALIVDVRSAEEFNAGHSSGAMNIPLQSLSNNFFKLDRDKMIITCCQSGARSAAAAGILRKLGYSKVLNAGSWQNTIT